MNKCACQKPMRTKMHGRCDLISLSLYISLSLAMSRKQAAVVLSNKKRYPHVRHPKTTRAFILFVSEIELDWFIFKAFLHDA